MNNTTVEFILAMETKVIAEEEINFEEAMALAAVDGPDVYYLMAAASRIRDLCAGKQVDLCSIINAKSGKCSENCKFCAQSAHFKTDIEEYSLLDVEPILDRARQMEREGAQRFSLVTSGRDIPSLEFPTILEIYRRLSQETNLKLCASLGIIGLEEALALKEVGVTMYHHNLETSESFFDQICTTHTYQERIETIKAVQQAGMAVCSGGIFSLGETMTQRLEMAFALRELQVMSVPLNVLNPIKGTALENQPVLSPLELLKSFALYRFILPKAMLRYAGGRENALRDLQALGFMAGLNAALVGSYLTTSGRQVEADIRMIQDIGLEIRK